MNPPFSGGLESSWVHLIRQPVIGLLYLPTGDYDGGEFGGMKIGRGH
jgi:hypothetical protein